MTMWIPFVSLVVVMLTGMSEAEDRCVCSQVSHPQNMFCTGSDFAYRVHIHRAYFVPTPGEPYRKMNFYPYWKYEAEILETFKADPDIETLGEGDMAEFYTPQISLCGMMALYDDTKYDYLFTGYVDETENGVSFMAITICTWVELWSDLTREQKKGLRGGYNNCNCIVFPSSGGGSLSKAAADKFRMDDCAFNPVTAQVLGVPDCEKLHGFCVINEQDNTCSWENTGIYQRCFQTRQLKLSQTGKPAVSSKEDCSVYRGRKRKQCILKFLKAHNRGRPHYI